ncbi:MAG: methyltransferase domain-containing protein [Lentisphaerae bacterium]|nr:methyltransferase domain-containing protein [Lentisphaerota bacterium]
MTTMSQSSKPGFDAYAATYDDALHRGVSLSGARKEFFAEARVAWLRHRLGPQAAGLGTIMDYGCGIGAGIPFLCDLLAPRDVIGVDISSTSLDIARHSLAGRAVRFGRPADMAPEGNVQLAFSNGTFHHIPPAERPAVLRYLYQAVAPGGWLAIWENNPWNPGTRLVMSRIPFDHDAVKVSAPALARLVRTAGFQVQRVDFLFVFPHALKFLRPLESRLVRLPLGAQYLVLARKPVP